MLYFKSEEGGDLAAYQEQGMIVSFFEQIRYIFQNGLAFLFLRYHPFEHHLHPSRAGDFLLTAKSFEKRRVASDLTLLLAGMILWAHPVVCRCRLQNLAGNRVRE